jgi:hypothetical protein
MSGGWPTPYCGEQASVRRISRGALCLQLKIALTLLRCMSTMPTKLALKTAMTSDTQ